MLGDFAAFEPNASFWENAWDETPMLAYEARKRARREAANEDLIQLETLLLDAEVQEFLLSSEAVRMEVEAERSRLCSD